MQKKAALASMEEPEALVRKGIAYQDLRRQKKQKLHGARRWEDEKEAMRQQKIWKAEREACVRKTAEEASVKAAGLQGVAMETSFRES